MGADTGLFSMSSDEGSGEDSREDIKKLFSGLIVRGQQGGGNKFAASFSAANSPNASPSPPRSRRAQGHAASLSYSSPAPSRPATLSYSSSLGSYNDYTHPHTPSSAPFSTATFGSQGQAPRTPTRERMTEAQYEAQAFAKLHGQDAPGYFASSMFQNSPSPEELPDPLFI
jgi:hypothetical protein